MLTVKATSKKNSGWWWQSTWFQSRAQAELVKEQAGEVFGDDWNIEVISQEPEQK